MLTVGRAAMLGRVAVFSGGEQAGSQPLTLSFEADALSLEIGAELGLPGLGMKLPWRSGKIFKHGLKRNRDLS